MRSIQSSAFLAGAILAGLLMVPMRSHAQNLQWGADAARASRPGVYIPYDGAPFAHRYGFGEGSYGPYGPQWWYQYQLDREERTEAFGTRYGPDHPPLFNRLLDRHRR